MKLTKQQKKEQAKELAKVLKSFPQLYVTEYKGLKFQELDSLRAKLRPIKGSYSVVKNSLLGNAIKEAGIPAAAAELLKGPVALTVAKDDPVAAAKVLVDFSKEFPNLKIKAGFVGDKWMDPADCKRLSAIGSRQQQLGQLAGVLYSAVGQGAWVLAAPIRDLALVLKALEQKQSAASAA